MDRERGKETVQLGRVMKILAELGIELRADVPDEVEATLSQRKLKGVERYTPRNSASSAGGK